MYFMRSVGDYGPWSGTLETEIQPLLEEYGVHMYVCGHDHNLQHLHHQNDTGEYGVHMYVSGHDHNLQHLHHQNDTGGFVTLSERCDVSRLIESPTTSRW